MLGFSFSCLTAWGGSCFERWCADGVGAREGKGREQKGQERKGRERKGKEGTGRERKGKKGKERERKGKEGKGRERKGKEGKGRERKGKEGKERRGWFGNQPPSHDRAQMSMLGFCAQSLIYSVRSWKKFAKFPLHVSEVDLEIIRPRMTVLKWACLAIAHHHSMLPCRAEKNEICSECVRNVHPLKRCWQEAKGK